MPVPQIFTLPGMDSILKPEIKQKLEKVEYSSRYALALFFDKFEADVILANNSGAHYIKDDPIFCYAAINTVRRGCEGQLEKVPTSVVFHTKVPWGIQHLEDPIPEVEKELIEHYKSRYFFVKSNVTIFSVFSRKFCFSDTQIGQILPQLNVLDGGIHRFLNPTKNAQKP